MKTPQITYLFGAGASAFEQPSQFLKSKSEKIQTLPTIANLPNRLNDQLKKIGKLFSDNGVKEINQGKHKGFNLYKEKIEWLSGEGLNHISVDIIARKLYLRGEKERLNELKSILSTFFSIEQVLNWVDPRYDFLFSTILEGESGKPKFPKNIQLLSWNYDSQIELSLSQFFRARSAMPHRKEEFHELPPDIQPIADRNVIKLNGESGFNKGGLDLLPIPGSQNFKLTEDEKITFISEALKMFGQLIDGKQEITPLINFAWEQKDLLSSMGPKQEAISKTDQLIIIGYSFPTFNRAIDKKLLERLNPERVLIQAPNDEHSDLIEKYQALTGGFPKDRIKLISQLNEFFVPFELE